MTEINEKNRKCNEGVSETITSDAIKKAKQENPTAKSKSVSVRYGSVESEMASRNCGEIGTDLYS